MRGVLSSHVLVFVWLVSVPLVLAVSAVYLHEVCKGLNVPCVTSQSKYSAVYHFLPT